MDIAVLLAYLDVYVVLLLIHSDMRGKSPRRFHASGKTDKRKNEKGAPSGQAAGIPLPSWGARRPEKRK